MANTPSAKQKIISACIDVLDNKMSILEAAREIVALRFDRELEENDEDIIVFQGIESEINHLPVVM